VRIDSKVTSYSRAQKATQAKNAAAQQAAKLVAYANAVTKGQQENFLKEYAFLQEYAYLKAVAAQRAAQRAAAAQQAAAAAAAARAQVAAPAPAAGGSDATSTNTADWACIRQHESGGNYSVGGGGAYQFELGTWEGITGLSTPAQGSPPAVQDAAALRLYSERGWQPWTTRFVCGL
jgi:membrane protein involved in colicin uptake